MDHQSGFDEQPRRNAAYNACDDFSAVGDLEVNKKRTGRYLSGGVLDTPGRFSIIAVS
jgi:hypothetical protein